MIRTAVVGRRADSGEPDTDEIRRLVEAAGGRVVETITQCRPEHPATQYGPGKVEEIKTVVESAGATAFVSDNPLSPTQTVTLEEALGARVLDRHRVVLEIFAEQASSRRAQLQVELARLRYELPRVRELDDPQPMNIAQEKGYRLKDLKDRIDELDRQLDEVPAIEDQWRQRRREAGFELVAIAGYTNAGKTTLLRRLATDLSLETETADDLAETAAIEDRLFKTLETTTRRAVIRGRDVLLTDTVGFLQELPHWLVESFRGTLAEIEAADAVLLVADLDQPAAELRRKLETTIEAMPADVPVITVLNKADAVADDTITERVANVDDLVSNPVVTSVREADELSDLETSLIETLPSLETAELTLPMDDGAMSTVSWLHDKATTVDTQYDEETVTVTVEAKPVVIAKARSMTSPN